MLASMNSHGGNEGASSPSQALNLPESEGWSSRVINDSLDNNLANVSSNIDAVVSAGSLDELGLIADINQNNFINQNTVTPFDATLSQAGIQHEGLDLQPHNPANVSTFAPDVSSVSAITNAPGRGG